MKLKTSTILVGISLTIALTISLSQWAIFTFGLLSYLDFEWLFRGIGLVAILLESVPLIIFFIVLNARQKG